jgi:uncharacterized protein YdhG (YjbR/CyaY superfamily)
MAKTDFKSIDEYISTFEGKHAAGLRAIRKAIRSAVPQADEVISYQIPAFKFHGWIFYMSAHKEHFSLSCPPPIAAFEEFATDLSGYEKTKSALKLPMSSPLPLDLIKRMAAFHAKVNLSRETKAASRKKPGARK